MLPVTILGKLVWSYEVIHSLWLPLPGLGVCGKDQGVHQDWLVQALDQEAGQQKSQNTLRSASMCLCLPAAC